MRTTLNFPTPSRSTTGTERLVPTVTDSSTDDVEFPHAVEIYTVTGEEAKAGSGSTFNLQEIHQVMNLVESIINEGVQQSHISVASPYKAQVRGIKTALNMKGFFEVFVGSAEQLQGKENEVLVISLVRTIEATKTFASEWRRFNVLVTRAKIALYIVGSAWLLENAFPWNMLFNRTTTPVNCDSMVTRRVFDPTRVEERDSKPSVPNGYPCCSPKARKNFEGDIPRK